MGSDGKLQSNLQPKQSATESVEQDASEGSSAPWWWQIFQTWKPHLASYEPYSCYSFADSCCRLLEDLNMPYLNLGIFRRHLHPVALSQVDRRHGRGWGKASRMAKAETLKSTGCFLHLCMAFSAMLRFSMQLYACRIPRMYDGS